jgi:hypothetical protein
MSEIGDHGKGRRGVFFWNKETGEFELVPPKPSICAVPAPFVISDEIIGGIESMVDGKIYDSKSALRRSYKEQGYIEKGNDRVPRAKAQSLEELEREIREDAEKAYYDLKYNRVEISEWQREQNNREIQALEAEKRRSKTRWAR